MLGKYYPGCDKRKEGYFYEDLTSDDPTPSFEMCDLRARVADATWTGMILARCAVMFLGEARVSLSFPEFIFSPFSPKYPTTQSC